MMVAWPIIQIFLKAYWKPILLVVLASSLFIWHKHQVSVAWHAGRTALIAEQAEEARRRQTDADNADAAARRCAADPSCRLQNDGHRRD